MKQLTAGQRWISGTEPELGLGKLTGFDDRIVYIRFDASDCIRQYTRQSAPLKRAVFKPGDTLRLETGDQITVSTVSESRGLIYYQGEAGRVCETDLSGTLSFSLPQERLFAGVTDASTLFDLRCRLLTARSRYDKSRARGFAGGQVELIPHQLYIAGSVTARYLPRVLLSDETGLGKTIEACLILHKLLITDQIERVLVIVPDSLAHQWFIELYRRFNLSFMVFDEAYCTSLETQSPESNPFLEHQLCIIGLNGLKKRQKSILNAGWDMVVIDEAHHITDDNAVYQSVRFLAQSVKGLMLLTATPEQMGIKNHFCHLALLDPNRYYDFDAYSKEADLYQETIRMVRRMIDHGENADHILDSYGPGRVVFRNRRSVIKGFPQRHAHINAFPCSRERVRTVNAEFSGQACPDAETLADDPRLLHLAALVKNREKVLVICSSKEKAAAIDVALGKIIKVDTTRFDETMSLLQRDRNAAWFSSPDGARVLICSEIGSEGRNFQFASHLFLFDLPQNPELLEQRIGRVDRIGQTRDIRIHVPCVKGSIHEILARWYNEGLNLFEKNINGVHLIYSRFSKALDRLIDESASENQIDAVPLETLIRDTRTFCAEVDQTLEKGKNILLEMNSFKPGPAKMIIDAIHALEADTSLQDILVLILDHYGIDVDFVSRTLIRLDFSNLIDEAFPRTSTLPDLMTFDRRTAIARDDVAFLSWDHPFVQQTLDYFLTNGTGSCASVILKGDDGPGLMTQIVFVPECIAPGKLNLEKYLPREPVQVVVDFQGRDMTDKMDLNSLTPNLVRDRTSWFTENEEFCNSVIPAMISTAAAIATRKFTSLVETARQKADNVLSSEIRRLAELKKINPDVRQEEIDLARDHLASVCSYLDSARPRTDALRLIRIDPA